MPFSQAQIPCGEQACPALGCAAAPKPCSAQGQVPAQVIDKRIPTTGLLAHVMVAKFVDHLPPYRQEKIFGRAGLAIPRSTLAQYVGQTGVQLQPLVDALGEAVLSTSGHQMLERMLKALNLLSQVVHLRGRLSRAEPPRHLGPSAFILHTCGLRYARTACEGTQHYSLICNLRARVKNLRYVECCMPRDGSA